MTKKHFIIIAKHLNKKLGKVSSDMFDSEADFNLWTEGAEWCILGLMNALEEINPRFNRETFTKAIGEYDDE